MCQRKFNLGAQKLRYSFIIEFNGFWLAAANKDCVWISICHLIKRTENIARIYWRTHRPQSGLREYRKYRLQPRQVFASIVFICEWGLGVRESLYMKNRGIIPHLVSLSLRGMYTEPGHGSHCRWSPRGMGMTRHKLCSQACFFKMDVLLKSNSSEREGKKTNSKSECLGIQKKVQSSTV